MQKGPECGPSRRLEGQVARPVYVTSPEVSVPGNGTVSSGSHPGLEMHGIGPCIMMHLSPTAMTKYLNWPTSHTRAAGLRGSLNSKGFRPIGALGIIESGPRVLYYSLGLNNSRSSWHPRWQNFGA